MSRKTNSFNGRRNFRLAAVYPVALAQRVVAVPVAVPVPVPYYVAAAQPVREIAATPSAGFPPDWDWRPVESFAALAPRANSDSAVPDQQFRYYCPDTREFHPSVETCDSSWLKVIP